MLRPKTWFKMRMTLIGLSVIWGGGMALVGGEEATPIRFHDLPGIVQITLGCGVLGILLLFPFIVAGIISFQAINPMSDRVWTRPTHHDNPFRFGNPLLFFHFAAFLGIAHGIGMVLMSFGGGHGQLLQRALPVMGGLGCLLGVRLAMRWCKRKMADSDNELPGKKAKPED